MKSSSSIFSWCRGVKIVVSRKDRIALSHGDNHFDTFVITLAENRLLTNINSLYNDVKSLSSIMNCCLCTKCVSSNNNTKPLSQRDNHWHNFSTSNWDTSADKPVTYHFFVQCCEQLNIHLSCCRGGKCVSSNKSFISVPKSVYTYFYNSTLKSSAHKQTTYRPSI